MADEGRRLSRERLNQIVWELGRYYPIPLMADQIAISMVRPRLGCICWHIGGESIARFRQQTGDDFYNAKVIARIYDVTDIDPAYREFYRDIGYDLDFNYIRTYLSGDVRSDTGRYGRTSVPWTSCRTPRCNPSIHFSERLFLCLAHRALVRRPALGSVSAYLTDIIIRIGIFTEGIECFFVQFGVYLLHFIGVIEAVQCRLVPFGFCVFDHPGIHLLKFKRLPADCSLQIFPGSPDAAQRP